MGLESVTYISDFVATNPVGATDPKSQGDDHIRNIKLGILNTFPSITGAVTATHTAINQTCVGTGGTFPAINGSALTALNASNIASGSLADARLSANVPLKNAANAFTAAQSITVADDALSFSAVASSGAVYVYGSNSGLGIIDFAQPGYAGWYPGRITGQTLAFVGQATGTLADFSFNGVAASDFARLSQQNAFAASSNGNMLQRVTNSNAGSSVLAGWHASNATDEFYSYITGTGWTAAGIAGGPTGTQAVVYTNTAKPLTFGTSATAALTIDASRNFNFYSGTVTTSNASASEVGKTGAPSRNVSASTNTAASDQGGAIRFTGGSGQTFTLDGDPPADTFVILVNASGNSWTIAASGTLTFGGTTGSRTLPTGCMCAAFHAGSGNWNISGQLT